MKTQIKPCLNTQFGHFKTQKANLMVINLQITPSPILRDYELQKFCDRAREDGRSPEEAVVSLILNSIGEQDIESQEEPAQEPKEEEAK